MLMKVAFLRRNIAGIVTHCYAVVVDLSGERWTTLGLVTDDPARTRAAELFKAQPTYQLPGVVALSDLDALAAAVQAAGLTRDPISAVTALAHDDGCLRFGDYVDWLFAQ